MKKTVFLIITCFFPLIVCGQEDRKGTNAAGNIPITTSPQPVTTSESDDLFMSRPRFNGEEIDPVTDVAERAAVETPDTATLNLPSVDRMGQVQPIGMYPYYWGGWYNWQLHPGLNVNIGASVSAQFGRGAMSGVGFSQNIAMMYAVPLSKKMSLAVGGYFNNMDWGRYSYREAGVNAVLGYRFNDHWEGYIYAQKSLTDGKRIPLPLYDLNTLGDRLGAAVKYNFNPSFSIQVSVESNSRPAYRDFYGFPPMFQR